MSTFKSSCLATLLLLLSLFNTTLVITGGAEGTAPRGVNSEIVASTPGESVRAGERNPVSGELKVLVIAIEFTDLNHTYSLSTFENRISGMDSYYREVSYGNVTITGDVAPRWYRSSHTMEYYGEDSGGGQDNANVPINYLVLEAIDLADPDINYRDYDTDGDGHLDHLIVVHAGRDQASSGDPNDIWSHRGQVQAYKDGVRIDSYALVSEYSPLSVFCHEFGHDLLLPDLYDYGYDSDGLGVWSLMAAGTGYGSSPAHLDPWCKYYLGWLNPIEVNDNLHQVVIPPVERQPVVYKLKISDTEYFLVENRQKISYDSYLPGRGLLIYHVDESMWSPDVNNIKHWRPNEDENHKFIDIEESTPRQDLDYGPAEGDYNQGDSTDPWLNSDEGFWFGSNPNSTSYYTPWKDSGIAVKNIHPSGDNMVADLIIQWRSLTVLPLAERDMEAGPGESVTFRFEVTSNRRIGDNITVDLRGNHLEWLEPFESSFELDGPSDSHTISFRVTVPPMTLAGYTGRYTVRFISSDGTTSPTFYFNVTVKKVSSIGIYAPQQLNFTTPGTLYLQLSIHSMSNFDEEIGLSYQLSGDNPGDYLVSSLPDSVRVPPFTWHNLTIGVTLSNEVNGGSVSLLRISATSHETAYTNSTLISLVVRSVHNLEVEFLTSLPVSILPGGSGSVVFTVLNKGNVEERLEVSSRPPPGWDVTTEPSGRFYIQPGGTKSVTITVSPPAGTLYREDGYKVNVTLLGETTLKFNFTVTVEKVPEVSIEATPSTLRLEPYGRDNITVSVRNTGNVKLTLALRVLDIDRGISYKIERNPIQVEAGETLTFNLTLTVNKMLSPGRYPFTFEAYSGELSLTKSLDLNVEVLQVVNITTTDFPRVVDVKGSGEGSFWVNNDGNSEVEVILSHNFQKPLEVVFYDQAGSVITSALIPRGSRVLVKFKVVVNGKLSPGLYRGNITLTALGGKKYTLPLSLNVSESSQSSPGGGGGYISFVAVAAAIALAILGTFFLWRRRVPAERAESPPGKEDNGDLLKLLSDLNEKLEEKDNLWARIHRDAAVEALNAGDNEKALKEINEAFKSLKS